MGRSRPQDPVDPQDSVKKPLYGQLYQGFDVLLKLDCNKRRDARAVEWDGLENRCMGNCTEGSNPSLSANHKVMR